MVRILLSGCNGAMGRVVTACVSGRCDCRIEAGFDINTESHAGFPVYAKPENCSREGDVIVDFSHPDALPGVLAYAREKKLPIVVATTGHSEAQVDAVHDAATEVPVFYSGNMSIGISLLMELARKAAAVLGNDFDVEILERHHNQKIDAPSGTAMMLAEAVAETLTYDTKYVYERQSRRVKRSKEEIGISAMRGGTIVGEHEVMFAGRDELVTISHSARSKDIFAVGAVNAALFLQGRRPGLYCMADLVAEA